MSLELFLESCKSPETKRAYSTYLRKFAEEYDLNVRDPRSIETMIIDLIIKLKKEKSYPAIRNYVSAVLAYYKINDVILNTTKINKFMPSISRVRKDRAYTHEEILTLLSIADERMRVIILLLASSGIRIGAIQSIKLSALQDKKLIVYESDIEEYFTFITPECKKAIDVYLEIRQRYGERLNDHAYLIREQFDVRNPGKPRQFKTQAIERRLIDMSIRLGMRNNNVPIAHGFRKFFTTQLITSKVNPEIREMLLGHKIGLASCYYRPTEEEMYQEYEKASYNLTINEENRLKKKIEKLEVEKSRIDRLELKIKLLEDKRRKLDIPISV
jgi:integrase